MSEGNTVDIQPTFSSFMAELTQRAAVSNLDMSKPLKLYVRSARLLLKQADMSRRSGDLSNSFTLFLRFCNLFVDGVQRHSEYKFHSGGTSELSVELNKLRGECVRAMDAAEELKGELARWWRERVEGGLRAMQEEREKREREETEERARQREAERRALAEAEEEKRASMARRQEMERFYLEQIKKTQRQRSDETIGSLNIVGTSVVTSPSSICSPMTSPPPATVQYQMMPSYNPAITSSHTVTERSQTPTFFYFTEAGMPLRPLRIPLGIINKFLEVAHSNTQRNIETCGILAGKLKDNTTFTLTTLIVPKQEGTPDTVSMLAEEEIVEVQLQHDLLGLGWIHTHPTQSCFMSSVDLHTHYPFQAMMAEAIAIVVAPRDTPNYGIFRLTDPPGLPLIAGCRREGFHPHPEPSNGKPIYVELAHQEPGKGMHVHLSKDLPLEVIDLRRR